MITGSGVRDSAGKVSGGGDGGRSGGVSGGGNRCSGGWRAWLVC